jgi:hypothetical protein
MAIPGITEIHQAFEINSRPSETMLPQADSRSHVQYIYLLNALCPAEPASLAHQTAITAYDIPELLGKRETHSLRQLAREYGVSHETIRSALSKERGS